MDSRYSVTIPGGQQFTMPDVCAGCGAKPTQKLPMARGATDETTVLELPVCKSCFDENIGDYWKRKLQMGLLVVAAAVCMFGGGLWSSSARNDTIFIVGFVLGGALLLFAFAAGRGMGRTSPVPMQKRKPFIRFKPDGIELFASTSFNSALLNHNPQLASRNP
jgi:hypothetical protein